MKIRHLVVFAAMAPAFGAYQYYYTDHVVSVDATKWVRNGSLNAGSGGLTSPTSGSLISSVAVPDGSGNYEVKMTLALTTNGGNFFSYLRASANSLANSSLEPSMHLTSQIQPSRVKPVRPRFTSSKVFRARSQL